MFQWFVKIKVNMYRSFEHGTKFNFNIRWGNKPIHVLFKNWSVCALILQRVSCATNTNGFCIAGRGVISGSKRESHLNLPLTDIMLTSTQTGKCTCA